MPRFGKSFKMYPRILPSQVLDVTDVIEDCELFALMCSVITFSSCMDALLTLIFPAPRQCTVCGKLAEYECKDCMDYSDEGLDNIVYCELCLRTVCSLNTCVFYFNIHLNTIHTSLFTFYFINFMVTGPLSPETQ